MRSSTATVASPPHPDDIVVTTGSQQGLSLLAMSLVDPGDVILVESPSYLAALQCFTLVGARLVPVPSTGEGVDLDALAALAAEHRPKAFYTVPTFHNPTGRTLPATNRAGIVEIAARTGFRVIEDDPYQQLRYSGEPVPSMATFADRDQVICTGSLSKILPPGCGSVGYARPPPCGRRWSWPSRLPTCTPRPWTRRRPRTIWPPAGWPARSTGLGTPTGSRRDALLAGLPSPSRPAAAGTPRMEGCSSGRSLPPGFDTAELLTTAIAKSSRVRPRRALLSREPESNTMRLSFTTYPPAQIAEGTRRLATVFAEAGST